MQPMNKLIHTTKGTTAQKSERMKRALLARNLTSEAADYQADKHLADGSRGNSRVCDVAGNALDNAGDTAREGELTDATTVEYWVFVLNGIREALTFDGVTDATRAWYAARGVI